MPGQRLNSRAQEFVINLLAYFEMEKTNGGPLQPLSSVPERVATALKISVKTVRSVKKRKENNPTFPTALSQTPRLKLKTEDVPEGTKMAQNPRMSCKIVLDTTENIKPGSTIYGRVICNLSSEQFIREIRCKLLGQEHTIIKSAKETYQGHNEFLHMKMSLVGEGTLQARQHEYSFCFTLPKDIPSTFETELGYIKYIIKATIDIPYAFDYMDEITVPVTVPLDVNNIQDNLQLTPITLQNEKTVCCLCCARGNITMNLQLEKNTFVLGEEAKLHIEIINMTTINIEEIMLTLTKITEYKSDGMRTEQTKEILTTQHDSGVGAHGQRIYLINFQIPRAVSVHNLVKCILIKEIFRLRVEILLPLIHRDLAIDAFIRLGHTFIENNTLRERTDTDQSAPPSYEELF